MEHEKSVGTYLVTRPTLGGLRIAHRSRTSNAEAHACMYFAPLAYLIYNKVYLRLVNTHPWTSTIASFLTTMKVCEVSKRQEPSVK